MVWRRDLEISRCGKQVGQRQESERARERQEASRANPSPFVDGKFDSLAISPLLAEIAPLLCRIVLVGQSPLGHCLLAAVSAEQRATD